jgi:hypothetical protein
LLLATLGETGRATAFFFLTGETLGAPCDVLILGRSGVRARVLVAVVFFAANFVVSEGSAAILAPAVSWRQLFTPGIKA